MDIVNAHGPLSEWMVQPTVERKAMRLFVNFLLTFEDEGEQVYVQRIKEMQSSECAAWMRRVGMGHKSRAVHLSKAADKLLSHDQAHTYSGAI